MKTIKDYYAVVLTSKWFYLSILATVVSYIALDQGVRSYAHDYVIFGSTIASFDFPTLRFFFLTFRYSIVFTEIGILCWAWYAPTTDPKFADTLPAGTPWQGVWLQFIDEENIMITAGHFRRGASYEDMNFADTRGKKSKPNAQWNFLLLLAKKGGELSFKDSEAMDRYKKQKQLLSDGLKQYFRIDYDPFHAYRYKQAYKIKLLLIPPKEMAEGGRQSGVAVEPDPFRLDTPLSHEAKDIHTNQAAIVNDARQIEKDWHKQQDKDTRFDSWSNDE